MERRGDPLRHRHRYRQFCPDGTGGAGAGVYPCALRPASTSGKFALGRMYQSSSDTTAVSAWPMNMANLILVGRGYTMDFYGLQYE